MMYDQRRRSKHEKKKTQIHLLKEDLMKELTLFMYYKRQSITDDVSNVQQSA